jgi:uncharacterized protein YuzB (UPF0349 family)
MIRICPNCSSVDPDNLKKVVAVSEFEEECIGECGQHEGKYFGYIDDELVVKDTEEEFLQEVKARKQ